MLNTTIPLRTFSDLVAPIFKRKGEIWNCSCNRAVRLLEHGMKVVKRVLEKSLHRIVSVD